MYRSEFMRRDIKSFLKFHSLFWHKIIISHRKPDEQEALFKKSLLFLSALLWVHLWWIICLVSKGAVVLHVNQDNKQLKGKCTLRVSNFYCEFQGLDDFLPLKWVNPPDLVFYHFSHGCVLDSYDPVDSQQTTGMQQHFSQTKNRTSSTR